MSKIKNCTLKLCFYCKEVTKEDVGKCPNCGSIAKNKMSIYVSYIKTKRFLRKAKIEVISCSSRYHRKIIKDIESGIIKL